MMAAEIHAAMLKMGVVRNGGTKPLIHADKSTDNDQSNTNGTIPSLLVSSSVSEEHCAADLARLVSWTFTKRLNADALAEATVLLMLAHTPVSRKVFMFFHCNNLAGKYFMFADYTVEC